MNRLRIHATLAALSAFTLAACSGERITATSVNATVSQSISVERPWSGNCDVAAEFTGETTLRITGSCQLAHIGRADVLAYQTIVPGPSGIAYTNTAIYTAANGDELHTTNVGIATPTADGLTLNGVETADRGTGRFENASGTAALTGAVRFTSASTTVGSYTLDGRLTF